MGRLETLYNNTLTGMDPSAQSGTGTQTPLPLIQVDGFRLDQVTLPAGP